MSSRYELVRLRNGAYSVRSTADAETFHPGIGPDAEAEALYVQQLRLPERAQQCDGEFVLWDVGLGAAANALTAIRRIREHLATTKARPKKLRLLSFDRTTDAVKFALRHSAQLEYLDGYEPLLSVLIQNHRTTCDLESLQLEWSLELGEFPSRIATQRFEPPHAILFDPHSPRKNPEMWTVPFFAMLFEQLNSARPCSLANFTRSTMARAAMLLGGFFVGVGHASGLKEETTVASNRLELLQEPLGQDWLERARRSDSAEPMRSPVYHQSPLSPETLAKLQAHPQFNSPADHGRTTTR